MRSREGREALQETRKKKKSEGRASQGRSKKRTRKEDDASQKSKKIEVHNRKLNKEKKGKGN